MAAVGVVTDSVGTHLTLGVVIPTRDRPDKLRRCLDALGRARAVTPFDAWVCDSTSDPETQRRVQMATTSYPWAHYRHHPGQNVAAARNFCVRVAETELVVSVDDDVYVEPGALGALLAAYGRERRWRVVAGTVKWDGWSKLGVMKPSGYGRPQRPGEAPDFLVSALFLYPRALGLLLPWNERGTQDLEDIFQSRVWRAHGVELAFAPEARAFHDEEHTKYGIDSERRRIYTLLADTLVLNRNLTRGTIYEFLGFAVGARPYLRRPAAAVQYVRAWLFGHRDLIRDWDYLVDLARRPLPPTPPAPPTCELGVAGRAQDWAALRSGPCGC